ncbi:hypothetical protein ACMYSP_01815 [Klebsiella sp. R390]|uniref:PDC sensor domain-containing protein n=1 Tax=Klebsiella sp. R390 TaxID=2755400 RepID=UPI003DA9A6D7
MTKSAYKTYPFTLLKSVLLVSLILLVIIIVCLTGLFNYQSHQVEEVVSKQLLLSNSQLVQHKLEDFFERPLQVSNLLQQYIQGSDDNIPEQQLVPELVYLTAHALNSTPAFKSLSWAETNGRYYSVVRNDHSNQIYLQRTLVNEPQRLVSYSGITKDSTIVKVDEHFDLTRQPWFVKARQKNQPFWSIERLSGSPTIIYHQPVFNKQGMFRGLISSGTMPADMKGYLQSILPGTRSALLIADEGNNIVASSGVTAALQQS